MYFIGSDCVTIRRPCHGLIDQWLFFYWYIMLPCQTLLHFEFFVYASKVYLCVCACVCVARRASWHACLWFVLKYPCPPHSLYEEDLHPIKGTNNRAVETHWKHLTSRWDEWWWGVCHHLTQLAEPRVAWAGQRDKGWLCTSVWYPSDMSSHNCMWLHTDTHLQKCRMAEKETEACLQRLMKGVRYGRGNRS